MKKIALVLMFLLVFVFQSQIINAQDKSGIRVMPSFFDLKANSGDKLLIDVKVENFNEGKIAFETKFYNLEYSGNTENTEIKLLDTPENPIASWIKYAGPEDKIIDSAEELIPFELTIPAGIDPGTYFGTITFDFHPINTSDKDNTNLSTTYQISATIYLTINSDSLSDNLSINHFDIKSTFPFSPNKKIEVEIMNIGQSIIRPRGVIEFYDQKGIRQSKTIDINSNYNYMLPQQILIESSNWEDETDQNKYFPTIGKYSAVLSLFKGNNELINKNSKDFFVIPPIYYLYIGIIISASYVSYRLIKRKPNKSR